MVARPVDKVQASARSSERLFFALWPDDKTRAALARVQRDLAPRKGRQVHPEDIHMTVVFLGPATPERRVCAERIATEVEACQGFVPFELMLDRIGSFPRARVFWCGASVCPPPLLDLVGSLNRGLADCGFVPERLPYRPHVTLARKVQPVEARDQPQPIRWRVDELVLVTGTGAVPRYRVVRRWKL